MEPRTIAIHAPKFTIQLILKEYSQQGNESRNCEYPLPFRHELKDNTRKHVIRRFSYYFFVVIASDSRSFL